MANLSGSKTRAAKQVTAAGIVEAIEQDVELSMEQAKDAAKEVVAAVEEKLGVGKPRARKPPTKLKPRAVVAKKAGVKTIKSSKPAKGPKGKTRER
jgi:hypothetical protein